MSDVILIGLPGSGKSSVGRLVAAATGRAFLDLDEEFERRHGTPPAAFIETRGEAEFRAAEAVIARAAAARADTVIATGGGTVIDPVSRWLLWHAGPVVWLDAPDDVLLDRLAGHDVHRPLTRDAAALARRRAEREPFYRTADLTVTGEMEPEAAFAVNVWGVRELAQICRELGCILVHFSTDYVFSGAGRVPWRISR